MIKCFLPEMTWLCSFLLIAILLVLETMLMVCHADMSVRYASSAHHGAHFPI